MANTTKYQKTPKSKAELIAEARIRQQHKKEAEAAQTPEQKQGIPVLSDIWNFIGNVPVVGKWYATLADFSTEAFQGAVSTIEGIVDMAASVVGKFGDENFKKKVQDFIKTDFTGTYITPLVKDTIPTEQSLITDLPEQPERIVRGVGQGIGQMAPALLTGEIGSAAGLGGTAVQAIGTGTFMAGAGGRGVQEAYQEGASYDEGLAYGILSGALEGAIERLTGGVGTKVFGKGLINKVVGKAAKSGLIKLAMNAAGEGFEEVLSEVLNPYLKRLTYDKDAPTATKEEILESAIIGALTSIALGSTAQDVDIKAIQDAQQEISRAWAENRMPDLKQAAQELQKLDAKTRKAILETTNLSRHIDENGNIKQVQQSEAYSPNLDESKLAYKPTTQALTAEQQEAKNLFVKLTKGTRGLVFAEMPEGVKGAYKDGVVYVNVKANAVQEIIKHELVHSVEGTKAYNKFAKHVLQTLIDNPELAKNIKGETLEQSITRTSELYQKVLEGKDLTEQQREILTEIVAQYSEKLLTDKTQIERLVNQDRSIAQKILDWIRDKIAVLKGKTKLERETIEFLRKAEKLYVEALEMPVVAKQKKYSLADLPDIDSEGRKLTKEQQEFFKDSKVRDEQGRLLVVYHGTNRGEFNVFKSDEKRFFKDGDGIFFTDSKKIAQQYAAAAEPGKSHRPRVIEAYLNIRNPYIIEPRKDKLPYTFYIEFEGKVRRIGHIARIVTRRG